MFFSLAVSVTLLPALIAVLVRPDRARASNTWLGTGVFARLVQRPRAVLVGTLAVVIVSFGTSGPQVSYVPRGTLHETDIVAASTRTFVFEIK